MNRVIPAVVAALVVVATLSALAVGGVAAQEATPTPATNETSDEADERPNNTSTAPGAQLAGVVGVGEAEFEGSIEDRAFGIQIAHAASNGSRAAVVAERFDAVESHVGNLSERRAALEAAVQNGSMSESEYRARIAVYAAESGNAARAANQSAAVAEGLPADVLAANGIDATAIRTLADRAQNLTGQEVAAIARQIAGPSAGSAPPGVPASGVPFGGNAPIPGSAGPGSDAAPNGSGANGTTVPADGETPTDDGPPNATGGPVEDTNETVSGSGR